MRLSLLCALALFVSAAGHAQLEAPDCEQWLADYTWSQRLLSVVSNGILDRRYAVELRGVEEVAARGRHRILFLANHPAYVVDPLILMAKLFSDFRPRFMIDENQFRLPGVRWITEQLRGVSVPWIPGRADKRAALREMQGVLASVGEGLNRGDNFLVYPSGSTQSTERESIVGKSAVEYILRGAPDVRIVLVRSRGLWGSSFSRAATGEKPDLGAAFKGAGLSLAASGLFFGHTRDVEVTLWEPPDFPRNASRTEMNEYLEDYFNEGAPPARYVPYYPWQSARVAP